MKCPACDGELDNKALHNVAVDKCSACSGIWFDHGEFPEFIDHFIDDHTDLPNAVIDLTHSTDSVVHLREPTRQCPRCTTTMTKSNYAYDSNVFVDRCHACNGTWVDGNEVKPLAIFMKGNPKLDKLGKSIAENKRQEQELVEGLETAPRSIFWAFAPGAMIPLGDNLRRRTVPVFSFVIILANLTVILWMYYSAQDFSAVFAQFGFVSQHILAGDNLHTFFTAMFLHAGLAHVAGNMLFMWVLADNVEDAFGHILFLAFYMLCGVCAKVAFLLLHTSATEPLVGASGAVAGVMGAYLVLYPEANIKTFMGNMSAFAYLGMWFLTQLLFAMVYELPGQMSDIAFTGHIGGFVAGIVLALLFKMTRARKAKG